MVPVGLGRQGSRPCFSDSPRLFPSHRGGEGPRGAAERSQGERPGGAAELPGGPRLRAGGQGEEGLRQVHVRGAETWEIGEAGVPILLLVFGRSGLNWLQLGGCVTSK